MNAERMRVLVDLMKATFTIAGGNKDVAETKKTYELVKAGCEKNENFKRGVELYFMEYALKVKDERGNGAAGKTFEELLKELQA